MWWMPWRSQAMKDVRACEKPRGVGNEALIRGCPNGETHPSIDGFPEAKALSTRNRCARRQEPVTCNGGGGRGGAWQRRAMYGGVAHAEFIGVVRRTRGTETSQYPEEEKSTEIPKVVASEIGTAFAI